MNTRKFAIVCITIVMLLFGIDLVLNGLTSPSETAYPTLQPAVFVKSGETIRAESACPDKEPRTFAHTLIRSGDHYVISSGVNETEVGEFVMGLCGVQISADPASQGQRNIQMYLIMLITDEGVLLQPLPSVQVISVEEY